MKQLRLLTSLSLAVVMLVSVPESASAWNLSIFGNGSKSFNSIMTSLTSLSLLKQQNNFASSTTVVTNSSTGNNTIKGTTNGSSIISTGSSTSVVSVTTTGGFNYAHLDTCCDHGECDDPEPSVMPTPTTTPSPTPTDEPECEEVTIWGETVDETEQGTLNSGDPITDPERMDATNALGEADGAFYSLGEGGYIVIAFDSPVADLEGVDLSFHEVTDGRETYPEETADVEVWDGGSWVHLGEVSNKTNGDGVTYLDLSDAGVAETSMVRITDSTDYTLHDDAADGYDLDAVDAVVLVCEEDMQV